MHDSLIVLSLVLSLGSPSYAHREAAQAALAKHLETAAPFLAWGEASTDPELAARCHALLAPQARALAAAKLASAVAAVKPKLGWPKLRHHPDSANGFPGGYTQQLLELAQAADDKAGNTQGQHERLATQQYVEWLLGGGWPAYCVQALLEEMWELERNTQGP